MRVNLGPRSYDIRFADDDFAAFARQVSPDSRQAVVIADANVTSVSDLITASLLSHGIRTGRHWVPPGDSSKSLDELTKIYDVLVEFSADRNTLIVAVGGGMVGDLAGFAAATFHRGLPFIMVPTTLLAMVDSSVGGKTAINHPKGKNLIGAIHQPAGVWIDLATLTTLPDREYRSGLAEVVKYGVALDAEFFAWLEAHAAAVINRDAKVLPVLLSRCLRLKADVVERDEHDRTGQRAVLNYGHTFAHAFETLGDYKHWRHGEAVSVGMMCAARLANRLGRIDEAIVERQAVLLERFGLPVAMGGLWPVDALLEVMHRDKKAAHGVLRFVLPDRLGHVELVGNVPVSAVREVLSTS